MSRVPQTNGQGQLGARARARAAEAAATAKAEAVAERSRRVLERANHATEALYKYLPLLIEVWPGTVTVTDILVRDGDGDVAAILPCVEVESGVWLTAAELYRPGHEKLFLCFGQPTAHPEDARQNNSLRGYPEIYHPWRPVHSLAELGALLERGRP